MNKVIKTPAQIVAEKKISGYINADFQWGEFIKPEDGIPTLEQAQNTKKVADVLSVYKHKKWNGAAITITCGGRSLKHHLRIYKELNDARAKKKLPLLKIPMGSWHLKFLAADFTVAGVPVKQVYADMDAVHFGGVECPDDQNRTHIDLRGSICRFRGDSGLVVAHHYNQLEHDKLFHS